MSREENHIKAKELTEDIIDIINAKSANEEVCVSSMCVILAQIIDKSDNTLSTYNSILEYLCLLVKKRIVKNSSSQSELKHY